MFKFQGRGHNDDIIPSPLCTHKDENVVTMMEFLTMVMFLSLYYMPLLMVMTKAMVLLITCVAPNLIPHDAPGLIKAL